METTHPAGPEPDQLTVGTSAAWKAREEWDCRQVLDVLRRSSEPVSVSEIAWKAGIGPSSVEAALDTLLETSSEVLVVVGSPTTYALIPPAPPEEHE